MSDTLADICKTKLADVTRRKQLVPAAQLLQHATQLEKPRGFKHALEKTIARGQIALIAEIKKASPSAGIIRTDFNPAELAKAYAEGGASCLSVITDEPYFQGRDEYLTEVRSAVPLPLLRKDFMLDTYQIVESRALGADAVLLIMAALSDSQAKGLYDAATGLGMDVLVEVHDQHELDRALTQLEPAMVGINNRNLKTLKVDMAISETLAKQIPDTILKICESGIKYHSDMVKMGLLGLKTFLVGESLMRETDVALATKRLLGIA